MKHVAHPPSRASFPVVAVLAGLLATGCGAPPQSASDGDAVDPGRAKIATAPHADWALAIHGGAGVVRSSVSPEEEPAYRASLEAALDLGSGILADGGTALDAVEAVIRTLEDDPLFNAGRGAVFTNEGTNELDAAIMDGSTLACGAVTGVKTVRHPITLARRVMERSPHIFFSGAGAEAFADEAGVERVAPEYFFVQKRYDQWRAVVEGEAAEAQGEPADDAEAQGGEDKHGTVGAVARDTHGNVAAATSTGGLTNKRWGRIGDVPVIGAGTYASNASAAVSCTGIGERFIEHTVARDVTARMEYGGESLQEAAKAEIHEVLEPESGGLIAVGADGSIAIEFNTEGMFHGSGDSTGQRSVGIWQ
ncbi:MAG: isoaspartyl peptidase/L-asparaginase [Acidobacteria bacterium]|nr:isoaspartyl peptidase/L-asparaginase [Acidobacteriota bacterium]